VAEPHNQGAGAFNATGVGTNAGVSVTQAAPTAGTNRKHLAVGIQCSGDAAAIVTVESPAATILYRKRFAAAFNMSESFAIPIVGAVEQAILVKISASTSNCEANIQGYTDK
jgi:hypothetical protein